MIKKTAIILSLLLLFILGCNYGLNKYWAKLFGGATVNYARAVRVTNDGGFVVVGYTDGRAEDADTTAWVIKLTRRGQIEWEKIYYEEFDLSARPDVYTYSTTRAYDVQPTSEGGYILVGEARLYNFYTSTYKPGGHDLMVIKLDGGGNVVWQRILQGSYLSSCSVEQLEEGSYMILSYEKNVSIGEDQNAGEAFYLIKLDKDGDMEAWVTFDAGRANTEAYCLDITEDGGYIIAGKYPQADGDTDAWILRLAAGGEVVWQKSYGGEYDDAADEVRQTPDGGFIVGGYTRTCDDSECSDAWAFKVDMDGEILWQRRFGGEQYDDIRSVEITAAGNYIMTGRTESFFNSTTHDWIAKLNRSGSIAWQKTYGALFVNSIQRCAYDGYIAVGNLDEDLSAIKMDKRGNIPFCNLTSEIDFTITETQVNATITEISPREEDFYQVDISSLSSLNTSAKIELVCR